MFALIIILAAAQYGLGAGRTIPTIAAVVGLISVIAAAIGLVRPTSGRIGIPVSLLLGVASAAVGVIHAAFAAVAVHDAQASRAGARQCDDSARQDGAGRRRRAERAVWLARADA